MEKERGGRPSSKEGGRNNQKQDEKLRRKLKEREERHDSTKMAWCGPRQPVETGKEDNTVYNLQKLQTKRHNG